MAHRVIRNPSPQQAGEGAKSEVEMLRGFFKEYGQTLIIAAGVCLAVVLGLGAYRNHKEAEALSASQLLMNARSSEELQQVVNQYPSAPIAPLALLGLASRYYDEGQYEAARHAYAQFETKYPAHALLAVASIGRAQCLEGEGQFEESLAMYEAFVSAQPDHFLAPLARLGKARTLVQMGRLADARVEYEDFITANPDSEWVTLAESSLMFVEKEIRAAEKGLPAEQPAAPFVITPALSGEGAATMAPFPSPESPDQALPEE